MGLYTREREELFNLKSITGMRFNGFELSIDKTLSRHLEKIRRRLGEDGKPPKQSSREIYLFQDGAWERDGIDCVTWSGSSESLWSKALGIKFKHKPGIGVSQHVLYHILLILWFRSSNH